MIHPDVELRYIDDVIGYGVFATKLIPEGTITYVKDSLEIVVTPDEYKKHNKAMQDVIEKFSFLDPKGNRIISWDHAKYVNHCCNPNTISTGYGFEMAIRDIQPGEQITDEYGLFNVNYEMELICSKGDCRKCLKPSDFDNYYMVWDEKIKKSIMKAFDVTQPLYPFLENKVKKDMDELKKDISRYKSVLHLKYVKNGVKASVNGVSNGISH